ncbi:chemotaxis protein CheA [Paenibacillus antri]|uniref:Chemotaxis protein CheA n=1 Tax=Paenibacillus antri TaxID=2582848 RepID=A0A5R9G8W5_9BACL|nr:chemotaxis protein CheA [Paenibacillus antri]TLS49828.1 chemotaxis protein CheA [Paenibacillus antri]
MDTNQYLSMFIDESREHLQAMNDNMLALENAPDDIGIVQNMFRSAHTLKGMSATMGFEDIASLTHEMENVLDLVRNGKLKVEDYTFETIFQSLDALEAMVSDIVDGGTGKSDVSSIVTDLKAIVNGTYGKAGNRKAGAAGQSDGTPGGAAAAGGSVRDLLDEYQSSVLQQSLESGHRAYRISVAIRKDCVLKAVRAYMVFDALGRLGEVIKSAPSTEDIEADRFDYEFTLVFLSASEGAEIEAAINGVSEIERATVQPITAEDLAGADSSAAAEAAAGTAAPEAPAMAQPQAATAAPAAPRAGAPAAAKAAGAAATRTIRVDIEKLDTLMNLFSEMLIDRVRLESLAGEIKRADLIETVEHMGRVSSDLQGVVMKLRMMPVESVFNRFPRMVRDVAKSLGKKVDLVITGADTELDRTVVDEIGDPLVHLLRNSVDHGIESIEERVKAGKPETGTVHLRAFHSGNHVFIEAEDDGKGINRDVVLKRAVKNGIVTKEQGDAMSDEAVYMLLFASGFSTAEVISDISGRGVGLDVVKSKIESLGGRVSVTSTLGKGSKFSIQLPLTLSIIMAMMVKLGGEKYAIPLSSIVETMILRKEDIRNVHGNRMFDYRSSVVPLVSLSKLFDVPDYSDEGEDETEVVIVRKGDRIAGLAVDELIGQQEIVLKALGKYLNRVFAVSGATILGDGQVALILDTNALIK